MSKDAELQCACGKVHGRVANASASTANHAICYCDDCQAYLHHLRRADLLGPHAGTDIVQVAPSSLSFDRGAELIAGVRLGPKGLHRWYATCCRTPVGNTVSAAIPFVGIHARAFDTGAQKADDVFGPPRGAILAKFAVGGAPASTGSNARMLAHVIRLLLGWKLRGQAWPHPFYDRAPRAPSHPLATLSPAEREALRPLCGPRPAAAA